MIGPAGIAWLAVCIGGIALSLQSIRYTYRSAPWTAAGWLLTDGYFILAAPKAWGEAAPLHLEYVCLAGLTIAFIVAGVKDEAQAEPWWWPSRLGETRRERSLKTRL
jgi:hypothetical protein